MVRSGKKLRILAENLLVSKNNVIFAACSTLPTNISDFMKKTVLLFWLMLLPAIAFATDRDVRSLQRDINTTERKIERLNTDLDRTVANLAETEQKVKETADRPTSLAYKTAVKKMEKLPEEINAIRSDLADNKAKLADLKKQLEALQPKEEVPVVQQEKAVVVRSTGKRQQPEAQKKDTVVVIQTQEVHVQTESDGKSALIMWLAIGAAVLAIIGTIVSVVLHKKKGGHDSIHSIKGAIKDLNNQIEVKRMEIAKLEVKMAQETDPDAQAKYNLEKCEIKEQIQELKTKIAKLQ